MLTTGQAWQILSARAPRDEWVTTRDLYALVEATVELDEHDRALVSSRGSSTRWHRTVRNALQQAKRRGAIEWDRTRGFRLPIAPSS